MLNASAKQEFYVQALQGDKILGHLVTQTLVQSNQVPLDTGNITVLLSQIVSNRFLAYHATTILGSAWPNLDFLQGLSSWKVGTCVESAVFCVYQRDPIAVQDLVSFLIQAHAAERAVSERNTKSRLLELGGTISPAIRTGGSDHAPIFTATAELEKVKTTAQGSNKKRAEMMAAAQLLYQILGEEDAEEAALSKTLFYPGNDDDSESGFDYGTWELCGSMDDTIALQGNESPVEWWIRGATVPRDAFARAMRAPVIFPESLQAVDSWVRRMSTDDEATVFAMIVTHTAGECLYVPAKTAPTANRARKLLGVEANRMIAQLVNITLSPESE